MKFLTILCSVLALPLAYAAPATAREAETTILVDDSPFEIFPDAAKAYVPEMMGRTEAPVQLAQAGDPRVVGLEEQVRQLNGRVEEMNFQILQMQEQMRKMQEDVDFRLQEIEQKRSDAGGAVAPPAKPPTTVAEASRALPPATSAPQAAAPPVAAAPAEGPGEPEGPLGSIVFDQNGNVVGGTLDPEAVEAAKVETDDETVAALTPSTSDPKELYRNSYESILSGDYGTAEAGFRQHIASFPGDAQTADAHYWLGESLFGQQRYRDAAEVFVDANRQYPDARKSPDMLLKLGVSLSALNQREVACATFSKITQRYPDSSASLKERLKQERALARVLSAAADSSLSGVFDAFDLSTSPNIIVAVSGGGDSLALLTLLARHPPAARLVSVTVDHGLRPESAAEARFVANLCAARGIRHVTMRWDGDKPATGLAAAAREARYRLLRQAAADHGASMILTGHTEDDQAETVAMRAARGEGRGLAGMAPATLLDGKVWLLRPLLGIRREALRCVLRAEGVDWIDDPSNENLTSERVRVRRRLADGAERDALLRRAANATAERIHLGRRAAVAIERHASAPCPGLIRLDPALIRDADRPAAVYALRLLLATSGGRGALPELDRMEALRDRLAQELVRATLSGAVIDARHAGIFVHREGRGLPEHSPPVDGAVWDGRFRMGGSSDLRDTIAPTGPTRAARLADDDAGAPRALIRAARAAEPSLWRDNAWLDLPSASTTVSATPIVAPFAHYLPSFDLAPARALAALVGGELPPPAPYRGHTAGEA